MTLGVFCPKCGNIMSVVFQYLWILPICMGSVITVVQTSEQRVFTWNRSNTMFQPGGASLSVPVGTNLVINCPNNASDPEFYKIYWIPKRAFENCFISEEDRSEVDLLLNCNNPNSTTPRNFIIEIKIFSGVPGGRDFAVGENHYIGTFSTGTYSGLGNEYHGACVSYNMKLNLTIDKEETSTTPAPTQGTAAPTGTKKTTKTTTTTQSTTTHRTTTTVSTQSSTNPTTTQGTTHRSSSTDIPDVIISVPDGGNTGVIDANSARTLTPSWSLLVLSLSLSLLYLLNSRHNIYGTRTR